MSPQKKEKKKHYKIRKACDGAGLVLLTVLCLWNDGIITVSARYQSRVETRNNSVTAADFYFESDLLDGKQHTVGLMEDVAACVTIPLRNYDDEQRCAETDIVYTVMVTDESNEMEKIIVADETGTLAGNVKSDANVTVSGLQEGKIYTITATTNNTYQKILKGTILISGVISETAAEEMEEQTVIQEEEAEEMIVLELESEEQEEETGEAEMEMTEAQEEGETEETEAEMTEAQEESERFPEREEQESFHDSEAQMVENNDDAGSAIDIDGQSTC